MRRNERVTDEMADVAARAMCEQGGFDPEELMPNDGPRWRYYCDGARAALSAALSIEQTEPVKVKEAPYAHVRAALSKIADMIDDENADLDDAIDIARAALADTSEESADV